MDQDVPPPSIDDRAGILATLLVAPLVSAFIVVILALLALPSPYFVALVPVAVIAGGVGSAPGEHFFEAVVRAVICLVPVAAIWYFAGYSHWLAQAGFALFAGFAIGGLTFGAFRDLTGR